ncbi:dynein light intermediate chain 2, putative [Plasmodium berghei]|uniref:Dynein light intermediate chain n=2 Tax=Plasmodium berghei TaxID=5821 RepID=A0A509AKS5_PLABA|nr:dynein intermediate light chain, putative [Plasmodium berghei ANKA]CXI03923.1 dynein light intermediate chain 2, putative [Plasmodium berghei]SCL92175.1 dynein light intermediate chain 2, putative [Plasmodium berghei]SCM15609.1 dynein light intermediate chain 2, putative [Plasmodium berghei]SCM17401.1 dynein light intermediate chain 2, putative [Plasmodium berghei]SCN22676.1 dynein light intermediate chain 2, putative [Plasmodium berghei]|eukprot:XP_034420207.1 dynein intermediate light chain, putative [Plasmodium berghei ANKA]
MKKEISNTSNNSTSSLKRGSTVTLWKKKGNGKDISKNPENKKENSFNKKNNINMLKGNSTNMLATSKLKIDDNLKNKKKTKDNKNISKNGVCNNGSQIISKKLTIQESEIEFGKNKMENEIEIISKMKILNNMIEHNENVESFENGEMLGNAELLRNVEMFGNVESFENEQTNEIKIESKKEKEVISNERFDNNKVNIFSKNEIKFESEKQYEFYEEEYNKTEIYKENIEKKENDDEKGIKHEQSSIYKQILKKLNIDKNEEVENSHIIILGNKDVGKSALLKSLQRITFENDGEYTELLYRNEIRVLPFDYGYLNVKDFGDNKKIHDTQGNSHVWILQHSCYTSLLIKNLKNFPNIKKIIILICTDLYKPYNIISDINSWIDVMHKIYEDLYSDYDMNIVSGLKDELETYIYNYKHGKDSEKKENRETDRIDAYLDFEKNQEGNIDNVKNEENRKKLIKINLSFPIIFVICKSDGYEILNNRTYQGYIDVIISYLRNLAISYQAAIIFCNTINKNELINVELLYKYMMHRLYNFTFKEKEILNCYEKIFIPSGYDDEKLINKSIKNTFVENFNKPYDSIIIKPITNKTIVAEHSQNIVPAIYYNDFLASIYTNLSNDNMENAYIKKDTNCIDTDNIALSNGAKNTDKGNRNSNSENNNGNNNYNSTNNENTNDKSDKFLHSFFQNLLEKGRSKSPSVPVIDPLILEKKKIIK